MSNKYLCYACNLSIPEHDLLIHKEPLVCKDKKTRNYTRRLHTGCLERFKEKRADEEFKRKELDERNSLWIYVKEHVLQSAENPPPVVWDRIKGAYHGKKYSNGNNMLGMESAYSYAMIELAFRLQHAKIREVMNSTKYKDVSHKFNTIMTYIILPALPQIKQNINQQKEANEKAKAPERVIKQDDKTIKERWENKKAKDETKKVTNFFDFGDVI